MTEFFAGDVHEVTQKLAYESWEQRGRPIGAPEVDWQTAEEMMRSAVSASPVGSPLSVFSMGPRE